MILNSYIHEPEIQNKKTRYNKRNGNGVLPFYLKRPNKNNSCQLNQKFDSILSDSPLNINNNNNINKIFNEKNKYKYPKNKGLYGIEQINLEINQKSNNSNIEISPKDFLNINNTKVEENKEKEEKNNYNNKTKKNSDFNIDKNSPNKISIKKI